MALLLNSQWSNTGDSSPVAAQVLALQFNADGKESAFLVSIQSCYGLMTNNNHAYDVHQWEISASIQKIKEGTNDFERTFFLEIRSSLNVRARNISKAGCFMN